MEKHTRDIVQMGWARRLGLADDALIVADPRDGPIRAFSEHTAMVVRLWDSAVVVGPDWLHERTSGLDPAELGDQTALLRSCEGHAARLIGQSVLAYTDTYVTTRGLSEVPASDDPDVVGALERACPPDDVTEVGLSRMFQALVTVDDDDAPLAGAGYAEWEGILGHLGVLTPLALRRAGHGTTAASLALNDALDSGLVPQWRARVTSDASRRLARRLGLTEVGSQTTVALG
ncbi:MAG TPA: GNAT family protein [Propionibacteriaceae bacterium]